MASLAAFTGRAVHLRTVGRGAPVRPASAVRCTLRNDDAAPAPLLSARSARLAFPAVFTALAAAAPALAVEKKIGEFQSSGILFKDT